MTRLYFIRHGESQGNFERRFLGNTDLDLTELGYEQARLSAGYFKNIHIDKIYASDLKRAYNTAAELAKLKNMDVICDMRLREVYAGAWEGMKFSDIAKNYTDAYMTWRHDIGRAHCTDGESIKELSERILEAVGDIAKQNPDKTVVIATHATPIRVLCTAWRGYDISRMCEIPWVSNASITEAEYENGKFNLVFEGYDEHLSSLKTDLPPNV